MGGRVIWTALAVGTLVMSLSLACSDPPPPPAAPEPAPPAAPAAPARRADDGPAQLQTGRSVAMKIPGGSFPSGEGKTTANVATFYIDETEVTNEQYRDYVAAHPSAGKPSYWGDAAYLDKHLGHPVVGVSFDDARAFCLAAGKRLPTGIEWERAARGDDGREYPWGNDADPSKARLVVPQAQADAATYGLPTRAVDDPSIAADKSPWGILGMGGNVSEWVDDLASAEERFVRGGSWASYSVNDAAVWRATPTRVNAPGSRVGFRCAISLADVARLRAGLASTGGKLEEIKARGVLRVGAEPETPPMLISKGQGWEGFDYEIARALAASMGVSVVVVPGRYAELPAGLARGDFDVIVSGYTPNPSLGGIAWSAPYLEYGLCMLVHRGAAWSRPDQLGGKKVGHFNEPVTERTVKALLPPTAQLVPFEDGYFKALADSRIDALIYDFPYAQAELKPWADLLQISAYNLSNQTYAVGVSADAPDLLAQVNSAISALRASEQYGALVRTWLGQSAVVEAAPDGMTTYTVQAGDTLPAIAKARYGDEKAWTRIWEANKHRLGSPDLIQVGMKLGMP